MDKKSQHVGDHGGKYVDQSGQTKQFTYIDHDVKPSMSTTIISKEEVNDIKRQLREYREDLIFRIVSLSASTTAPEFYQFTVRGDKETIEWNKAMLTDPGISIDLLRDICTLTERRNNI